MTVDELLDLIVRGENREARASWCALRGHADVMRVHVPVARLLLHRAQLDLAETVLNDIPADVIHPWITALRRHHAALREAAAHINDPDYVAPPLDLTDLPPLPLDPLKYLRAAGWVGG